MAFAQIFDHAARALARVLTQFRSSAEFLGILNSLSAEVQQLEDGANSVFTVRQIDNATGVTLDRLGKLVGAPPRGTLSDVDYRKRIHTQILVNKSSGTAADFVAIALAFRPEWAGLVKTREGGMNATGYAAGSLAGYVAHVGAIEIVCVPDTAASSIPSSEARELARFLRSAAVGGVRPILIYRSSAVLANRAFRFGGGTPPEVGAGFGDGLLFNALDH